MKIITYIILLFLIPNTGFGQKETNTLLWEVSHPDNPYKSYLLGTFHEVNPDFFDKLAAANQYMKESELLFVENYEKDPASIERNKKHAPFVDNPAMDQRQVVKLPFKKAT